MHQIIVHPLVLLQITDHHARYSSNRVIGVLLGTDESEMHVTNSFALPFEESKKTFFIDTSYLENMLVLHRKINSKEKVLGWYHTAKVLQAKDPFITTLFESLTANPLLLVVDLSTENVPLKMYRQRNTIQNATKNTAKNDTNDINYDKNIVSELCPVQCRIEAEEAEDVGVEHLLRDIKEDDGEDIKESLILYNKGIKMIVEYIDNVINKKIECDMDIMNEIQECLNERIEIECKENISECYLACLIKSVCLMKDLQSNRKQRWENLDIKV
ncbi:proteasome regulatory particle subunit [Binucleata daphniae]